MREIVLRPEPFLHELEHVTALHLRVLLGNGLLGLGKAASQHSIHHLAAVVITVGDGDTFYSQLA